MRSIVVERVAVTSFTEFVRETEPRLKVALSAAFGPELGVEATAHALAYGWEHWDRVKELDNPAGYLWGVGRNHALRLTTQSRRLAVFDSVPAATLPWVEPALPAALGRLTERQRVCVLLVKGLGWTFTEAADLLGIAVPSVQKHVDRGMAHLRRELGVD